MTSSLRKVNLIDAANGFFTAFTGAALTALLQYLIIVKDGGVFTIEQRKMTGIVGLIAGLSYVVKRFFSDKTGTLLGTEK